MSASLHPSQVRLARVQHVVATSPEMPDPQVLIAKSGAAAAETLDRDSQRSAFLPNGRLGQSGEKQVRVYLATENQLLRQALARLLTKDGSVEVIGLSSPVAVEAGTLTGARVEVLLLVSQADVRQDLTIIQRIHSSAPGVRILMIGSTKEAGEFLQCVRAGISGYLRWDASAEDVLEGIRAVHAGEAVCPGELCAELFRYFEREAPELPCASPRQRLGLTRREQQLVPLIAKGFTNKEIANHFCLSEQTVKNHLYRMKHKIGAVDRLSIVQRFRTQGFLL
jgi:DNA-binding NarL/FixJ family response regulator